MSDVINIDLLNDDCLLLILEKLPMKERFIVPLVCQRWNSLCQKLWKTTTKIIINKDEPFYFQPVELKLVQLLKLCGKSLRTLSVSEVYYKVLKSIYKYCDYHLLKDLTLKGCSITDSEVDMFCLKFHCLTKLELNNIYIKDDTFHKIISSNPKLKYLELLCVHTLTKLNFETLNEVETLEIADCHNLKNKDIVKSLKTLKKLKTFDIITINSNGQIVIKDLVEANPHIEELTIITSSTSSISDELHLISNLKNLRSLFLFGCSNCRFNDQIIEIIVNNCCLLECIILNFRDINNNRHTHTNEGIKLLAKLPKLKSILGDFLLNMNDEVLNILKEKGVEYSMYV